jgi:DNA polymerase III delta subunit
MDLVQAVLGGDAPAAAAALERLCQVGALPVCF